MMSYRVIAIMWVCAWATAGVRAEGPATSGPSFPEDAGFYDVKKDFGAVGDGVADDTAALRMALDCPDGLIYFPPGIYRVTDTVSSHRYKHRWIRGENMDSVIIRLDANCPGFGDSSKPRAVLSLFNSAMDSQAQFAAAMGNVISNITIEVGEGNSGAVALNFYANQYGAIENVRLRSLDKKMHGKAGLALVGQSLGPVLIRGLDVIGFDTGIWANGTGPGVCLKEVILREQLVCGILNKDQNLSILGMHGHNSVPYLQNDSGRAVMLDASMYISSPDAVGIINHDALVVRNIETYGMRVPTIRNIAPAGSVDIPDSVSEYANGTVQSLFPTSAPSSLSHYSYDEPRLPDPSQWARVDPVEEDNAPAIQKAIDSGKPVVYLAHGRYVINSTVHIRGKVHYLLGMDSTFAAGPALARTKAPVFSIERADQTTVVFEHFSGGYDSAETTFLEDNSNSTLILRDCALPGAYHCSIGRTGAVDLENVAGGSFEFQAQPVTAYSLHCSGTQTKLTLNGTQLWAMNFYTETAGASLVARSGSRVELWGGHLDYRTPDEVIPLTADESELLCALLSSNFHGTLIRQSHDGQWRELSVMPALLASPSSQPATGPVP